MLLLLLLPLLLSARNPTHTTCTLTHLDQDLGVPCSG